MQWKVFIDESERCEEQYLDDKGNLVYMVITKDKFRDEYYLLDVSDGKRKEICKADNPVSLRKRMRKLKEWLNAGGTDKTK